MTTTMTSPTTRSEQDEARGPTTAQPGTALRLRANHHSLPSPSVHGHVLVGRREQRAALAALVDDARAGRSGAVMLRGERGSGKTWLLDEAIGHADGCVVLRATGVAVESGLTFGAVQQLCGPLGDRVAELPPPLAEALSLALGLATGPTPDPMLVGNGLAHLLATVASEQPVVCVVDDAEWIDPGSAQAIGVASRRLACAGVVLLVAAAGPEPLAALASLEEIRIPPLSQAESHQLLTMGLPGRLDPDVRDRILAEARGNPRTIREVSRSTDVTALAGGFAIDLGAEADLPLDVRTRARLSSLSDEVAAALLLAAAEPLGDTRSFRAALVAAGLPPEIERAAESSDIIDVGERVLFSHPLVRHVLYRSAGDGERRAAHRVLARSLEGHARADHAAWHRAQACAGTSEALAAATERWGEPAGRAGGVAAAAAFLERAAALSEDTGARARRALDAARLHRRGGAFEVALRLVADLDDQGAGDATPATAHLVPAEVAASLGLPGAARDLLAAAGHLAATRPELSAPTRLSAFDAAASAGRLGTDGALRQVAAHSRSTATGPGRTPAELLLQAAATRWSGDGTSSHDALARAIEACETDGATVHPMATQIAMALWDEKAWATLAKRGVDRTRRTGAAAELPSALDLQACLHLLRGEIADAEHVADEAATVARSIGVPEPALARVLLSGWRCSAADPLEWIEAWSREARDRGDGRVMTLLDLCRSLVHMASGRYDQALRDAERVFERDEPFVSTWAAPEVVEAAVRSGRPEDAARAFAHVRAISDATKTSWARGTEQRCLALLVDDGSTEEHFEESIRHLEASGMRLDVARTHLLYGEWLRRQARRVDARTPLRLALEVFDAAGAVAFATRASLELRSSGEQARRRTPDTLVMLTERESQIAHLASDGRSNPEIATQLFISARTVEYHLHKVFSKLGITSRAHLRAALQR